MTTRGLHFLVLVVFEDTPKSQWEKYPQNGVLGLPAPKGNHEGIRCLQRYKDK